MKFVVATFILILSVVMSFITSGIEHRLDISKDWNIHIFYYIVGYAIVGFSLFKIRFKNVRVLKFYLFRKLIKLNKVFHLIDSKVYSEKVELNNIQEKSIKLWNSLLKDKSVELQNCWNSSRRIIKKGSLICIFKYTIQDSSLIVMQNNGVKMFYDIFIPQKNANEMANLFDDTQQKKIDSMIEQEKKCIENILDSF